VAPDHPWVIEHPECFITGDTGDLQRDPASFIEAGGIVCACGRDPFFPAWQDTLQLNACNRGLRQVAIETVTEIASQCDAVRCDMAMLVMNRIFERTWGSRSGEIPDGDYWPTIIPAVRERHPGFKFIAEAYWGLEWELLQQGFDYCYDKTLYDRMVHDNAESVRLHLLADLGYQQGLVRFIENHDEPRAAAAFSPDKERAAAVVIHTLTGAKLVHEGQLEGMKTRLPVFLGRRPDESVDPAIQDFYHRLLKVTHDDVFRNGQWRLCERSGWPDNQSCLNILSWCWAGDDELFLVVVNFSNERSQARVRVPRDELRGKTWRLFDPLAGATYDRSGDEMRDSGLYVDLGPWMYHFFRLHPL